MHEPVVSETVRTGDRMANWVTRNMIGCLVASYGLAGIWPSTGLSLREWQLAASGWGGMRLSLPLLLLALMLFCAAIATDWRQIHDVLRRPATLLLSLAAAWLGPAILVVAAGWLVPWVVDGRATDGLLVGMLLVAAMPVANSSVGWSQHSGGNLALSLALVVLSIVVCPLSIPLLLKLLGISLSAHDQALSSRLVSELTGDFFIVWVILPTVAGVLCRNVVGEKRLETSAGWISLASAAALLLLNYINASLAVPKIHQAPARILLATAVLAIGLSCVGIIAGGLLARLLKLGAAIERSLWFGLSMKHTGLALTLAGAVLADQPLAILMIVLATLTQHLVAGTVQWWDGRR